MYPLLTLSFDFKIIGAKCSVNDIIMIYVEIVITCTERNDGISAELQAEALYEFIFQNSLVSKVLKK